jgi:hypothetical protein
MWECTNDYLGHQLDLRVPDVRWLAIRVSDPDGTQAKSSYKQRALDAGWHLVGVGRGE